MSTDAPCRRSAIQAGPEKWRRAIHCGWVEAQNGFPYTQRYESMSPNEQIGYELGRFLAVAAITAGVPLPHWDGDREGAGKIDALLPAVCRDGRPWP